MSEAIYQNSDCQPACYMGNQTVLAHVQGFKMLLPSEDTGMVPHLIMEGFWEQWVHSTFLRCIEPGMTVIDAGANVGYYTLLASRAVGDQGWVIAFEPEPRNYKYLAWNVDMAGAHWCTPVQKGLWNCSDNKKLYKQSSSRRGDYSMVINDDAQSIETKVISLDDYLGEDNKVDVIKLDCEGAEPWIIEGMTRTIEANDNIRILMEFSPTFLRSGGRDPIDYLHTIKHLGFEIELIEHDASLRPIDITDTRFINDLPLEMLMLSKNKKNSSSKLQITDSTEQGTDFMLLTESPPSCKICGSSTKYVFALPHNKRANHPIPDEPDDCPYFQCKKCKFLFTPARDADDQASIYDETYWNNQDPDWSGRVSETLRLILLSNSLLNKTPDNLEVLDYGCGMGCFVDIARRSLQMEAWGTDIIQPKYEVEHFIEDLDQTNQKFDIITACEVIEHLPDPLSEFRRIRKHLKSPGVFAFQTAAWDPSLGREWWYLGPHNGHISIESEQSLDVAFKELGGVGRKRWNNYPGVQAWLFD